MVSSEARRVSPLDAPLNSHSMAPPSSCEEPAVNVFIVLTNELLVDAPRTVKKSDPAAPVVALLVSNALDSKRRDDVVNDDA
jgi:hypothetical protein